MHATVHRDAEIACVEGKLEGWVGGSADISK